MCKVWPRTDSLGCERGEIVSVSEIPHTPDQMIVDGRELVISVYYNKHIFSKCDSVVDNI